MRGEYYSSLMSTDMNVEWRTRKLVLDAVNLFDPKPVKDETLVMRLNNAFGRYVFSSLFWLESRGLIQQNPTGLVTITKRGKSVAENYDSLEVWSEQYERYK